MTPNGGGGVRYEMRVLDPIWLASSLIQSSLTTNVHLVAHHATWNSVVSHVARPGFIVAMSHLSDVQSRELEPIPGHTHCLVRSM